MDTITNYLNTLIFVICIKGLSICLLVLLIFDIGQKYSYVILTLIVCLVILVIIALVKIYQFDQKMKELQKAYTNAKPYLSGCPDYYTRVSDEQGNTICKNSYKGADGKYTYTMNSPDVNMSALVDPTVNKDMTSLCTNLSKFSEYPWSEYKARCNELKI